MYFASPRTDVSIKDESSNGNKNFLLACCTSSDLPAQVSALFFNCVTGPISLWPCHKLKKMHVTGDLSFNQTVISANCIP